MSRLVVVGIEGDARSLALHRALKAARRDAIFVSWRDALEDTSTLTRNGRVGDLLRVDSPGADPETWHALARLGGSTARLLHGEWRPGRAWFAGLGEALFAIERATPHLAPTHPARDILAMTDKLACDAILRAGGVQTPETFTVESVSALRDRLRSTARHAVFVKPRWGSSGAGVLAYRWSATREQLITTARFSENRVFNDKRLTTYTDRESIDRLLGVVIDDGAIVQRWIPKASVEAGPFDLRVLVIAGRIEHRIARVGRGTITNLHIDASRLDADRALASFDARARERLEVECRKAAACFPRHAAIGIDVMLDPRGRPFVLECNAWGDHLPRLTSNGLDTYEAQVREMFRGAA